MSGGKIICMSYGGNMNIEELIKLHKCAINNRQQIEVADMCGCFYCKEMFYAGDVTEWTDNGQTAICPYCGVDSVICNTDDYKIIKEDLEKMNEYYFKEKK